MGNGASFLASFTIFALFAYSPLYIQGALGKTPLQMAIAMLSLSLGWSVGALSCGQIVNRLGEKPATVLGSLCLVAGGAILPTFSTSTSLTAFFIVLGVIHNRKPADNHRKKILIANEKTALRNTR